MNFKINNDMESKSVTKKTLEGFFWMFSGKGTHFFLQLVIIAVLARLISPESFGFVGAALVVISFSEIFSQIGIGPAIVQRPNLSKEHICTGFTVSLLLGFLFAVVIYIFAPLIEMAFNMSGLEVLIKALALLFPIHSISIVSRHLLQREMQFKYLAGAQVVSYIIGYLIVGVVFAYRGFGEWALVFAHLSQALSLSSLLLYIQPHPKTLSINGNAFKELMSFGGGFTLARLFSYVALQGDNFVVGRWLGAGALGIYSRAYQMMSRPATFLGEIIDQVLFPAMSKVQSEEKRLTTAYLSGVSLIALTILPMSVYFFLLAPEIVRFLLGSNWDEVIIPFQILAVSMLFRSSYKVSDSITRAKGAVYARAWRKGIYAILIVLGAWVGQNYYGLPGVALGVLFSIVINYILMAQLSLKLLNNNWLSFIAAHIPALFISLIIAFPLWLLSLFLRANQFPVFAVIIISGLTAVFFYLIMLKLFPVQFLGKSNIWLLKELIPYIPTRAKLLRTEIQKITELV